MSLVSGLQTPPFTQGSLVSQIVSAENTLCQGDYFDQNLLHWYIESVNVMIRDLVKGGNRFRTNSLQKRTADTSVITIHTCTYLVHILAHLITSCH